jgi:dolichol-phosphate mannosyltransferase
MQEEAVVELTSPVPTTTRARVQQGMRLSRNWLQLGRFALVGASGYVVNLACFTALVHGAGVNFRLAALGAFVVAVTNNFVLNRHWTFRATDGQAHFQAARFLVVSLAALGLNLAVLELLVSVVGLPEVPAQAVAIIAATPLSFLGNKLWSFRA